MNDDLLRELGRIQRYAAGLQELVAEAETRSPRRAEGTDSTGSVHVVLGPAGVPKSYRVDQDWDRKLRPEAFGTAVVEAFQAAVGERLAAWTTNLQEDGWQSKVDSLEHDEDRRPAVPPALRGPAYRGTPRDVGEIAEDMIKAIDSAKTMSAAPPSVTNAVGEAAGGKLAITLSKSGLVSCDADPSWVSDQTATRLMNALAEALVAAKAELAKTSETKPARPFEGLLGEALALLNDPQRLSTF